MIKDFVTFLFPGVFWSEDATYEIEGFDFERAIELYKELKLKPFAFYFTKFERGEEDWNPKEIERSGKYYINGDIKTLEDVKAENDPRNQILIDNMICNRWDKIIVTRCGNCQPFFDTDVNMRFDV